MTEISASTRDSPPLDQLAKEHAERPHKVLATVVGTVHQLCRAPRLHCGKIVFLRFLRLLPRYPSQQLWRFRPFDHKPTILEDRIAPSTHEIQPTFFGSRSAPVWFCENAYSRGLSQPQIQTPVPNDPPIVRTPFGSCFCAS